MEKTIDKLPELVYDLLSIFVPGLYCYCAFNLLFTDSPFTKIPAIFFVDKGFFEIFFIYILGHIVNSFGTLMIPKFFNKFFGNPVKLLLMSEPKKKHQTLNRLFLLGLPTRNEFFVSNIEKKIKVITKNSGFKLEESNHYLAYEICRNYVMEKASKRNLFISKQQAYGEMSRSIIFVSLVFLVFIVCERVFYHRIVYFWYVLIIPVLFLIAFTYKYLESRFAVPYYIYLTTCLLGND